MRTRKGALLRPITVLGLLALAALVVNPWTASADQVCGCKKNLNGKIKRLVSPGPPTCSSSYTPICWNEDPPPGEISVRVFNSAGFNIPDDSQTPLTWDMEEWDTANLHSTTTDTSRLTAPVAGKYLVFGSVNWNNLGSGGNRTVALRFNNSVILAAQSMQGGTVNAFGNYQAVSTVAQLGVGDFVECVVHQATGAPLLAGGNCGMTKVP